MKAGGVEGRDWQRLDRWMWCARFLKTRAECARLVGQGLLRLNRQVTDKPHARVRAGDVLTLPLRGDVWVVRVVGLASRRGPAREAQALYTLLEDGRAEARAGHEESPAGAGREESRAGLRTTVIDCISGGPVDTGTTGLSIKSVGGVGSRR